MANITASLVDSINQSNELAITCRYNNVGPYAASNPKEIAPYLAIAGLPSLGEPICVQNAMVAASGTPIGNGQAVIMPPDVCFAFQIGYLCSLGFNYTVTLLPVNEVIRSSTPWPHTPPRSVYDWSYATVDKWTDESYITVADAQFALKPTAPPAQANYVKNSFQIRIDVWPMTSFTLLDGTTYHENMAAPGAMPAPGGGSSGPDQNQLHLNTHNGTVGKGTKGDQTHYTEVKGWDSDKSRTTSVVFDILVMNEKYYSKNNAQLFTNPNIGD